MQAQDNLEAYHDYGATLEVTFLEAEGEWNFGAGGREALLLTSSLCLDSGTSLPSRRVFLRDLGSSEWSVRSDFLALIVDF